MRLTLTDEANGATDAPNRDLPHAGILRKDAEFCELDRMFLTADALKCLTPDHPTPFYLYDGAGIQRTVEQLFHSFSFLPKMQAYLPVRCCAYRELVQLLDKEGVGFYCETPEELSFVCSCGVCGERIRYGAMIVSQEIAAHLRELDATLVIYSNLNLPSIMPRKVDFLCSDFLLAGVTITSAELEQTRLGLNIMEISRLVPLFQDIGAETFGISVPAERAKARPSLYSIKLLTLKKAADMVEEQCGTHLRRFDLGSGFCVDYSRPETLTDDSAVAESLQETVNSEGVDQTVLLCPIDRLLARFALFVTSVVGIYRHHGAAIVVNASCDSIADQTVRRRCHVSVAGKEWMDDRFLYYIAGLRASENDCFKRSATVRPPEIGDLIVFHDVGAAVPPLSPHAALLHLPNGNVIRMTR